MKKLISSLLLSFVVCVLQAQIKDPVKFKIEFNTLSDTEAEIVFTAAIDKGWHVYSTELGDGGPISATFNVDKTSGIELLGKLNNRKKRKLRKKKRRLLLFLRIL